MARRGRPRALPTLYAPRTFHRRALSLSWYACYSPLAQHESRRHESMMAATTYGTRCCGCRCRCRCLTLARRVERRYVDAEELNLGRSRAEAQKTSL